MIYHLQSEKRQKLKPVMGGYRVDVIWNFIHCMKRPDGQSQFPRLSSIALLVLTIPHSNATEERVFSLIRKNKTVFRPNLDPNETLGSIVTVKMELQNGGPTSKYDFPPNVLSAEEPRCIIIIYTPVILKSLSLL